MATATGLWPGRAARRMRDRCDVGYGNLDPLGGGWRRPKGGPRLDASYAHRVDNPPWIAVGELGVDAGTCAMWDASAVPDAFRLDPTALAPSLPTAFVAHVGDDIDGLALVQHAADGGDVLAVQIQFVDDVAELPGPWSFAGTLAVPTGELVVADPYCTPTLPYRRRLAVRAGRWNAQELSDQGDWKPCASRGSVTPACDTELTANGRGLSSRRAHRPRVAGDGKVKIAGRPFHRNRQWVLASATQLV